MRFGSGFVLNGFSPQLKASYHLQFTNETAAIRMGNFDIDINALRIIQLRDSLAVQDDQETVEIRNHTPDLELDPGLNSERQPGPAHLGKEGKDRPNERKSTEGASHGKTPGDKGEGRTGRTAPTKPPNCIEEAGDLIAGSSDHNVSTGSLVSQDDLWTDKPSLRGSYPSPERRLQ